MEGADLIAIGKEFQNLEIKTIKNRKNSIPQATNLMQGPTVSLMYV